ncbi:hypothetical protein [Clostridium ihumii]|uniref:hypothetical protein n=1 Tax=Clostridium ihumii TaxID=1470356 RepID=UPI00058CF1C3|nr:hypothetical protein [Clostridium ihumii]
MLVKDVMVWGSNSCKPKYYECINVREGKNNYFVTIESNGNDDYDLINLDTDEWVQLKRMVSLEYKQLDECNIKKPEIRHDSQGAICKKVWTLNVK